MNAEVIEKLALLRKAHGYSQESLAAALNISRQAISKWERGEASPDTDNLIALARLYRVSLDELLMLDLHNDEPDAAQDILQDSVSQQTEAADLPDEPEPEMSAPETEDFAFAETPAEAVDLPNTDGFSIENKDYVVHIKNGELTVLPKRKKRSFGFFSGFVSMLKKKK